MRKILLNYLRSFKQYFGQMIGVLLFLVILSGVAIGMMTTSLQIHTRTQAVNRHTNKWDLFFESNQDSFTTEFVYQFFYQGQQVSEGDEVFLSTPNSCDDYNFLSERFRDYLIALEENNLDDSKTIVANEIKKAMGYFSQGALVNSNIKDSNGFFYGKDFFSKEFMDYLHGDNPSKINFNYEIPFYVAYEISNNNLNRDKIQMTWSLDLPTFSAKTSSNSDSKVVHLKNGISRDFNNFNNNEISQVIIQEGRNVNAENFGQREIVLTDKFARLNNLKVGSQIFLNTGWNDGLQIKQDWNVVGIGIKYEDLATFGNFADASRDMKNFGYGYVDDKIIGDIIEQNWINSLTPRTKVEITKYINFKDPNADLNMIFKTSQINEFGIYEANMVNFNTLNKFKNQFIIISVGAQMIMNIIIGFLMVTLAFIFIMFLIKKELQENIRQIGIFKAFGYQNSTFAIIFSIKTTIIIAIGVFFGLFVSLPLQNLGFKAFDINIMFFIERFYFNWFFLVVLLIFVPLFFGLVSFMWILLSMQQTSLEMMEGGSNKSKQNNIAIKILQFIFFPFLVIKLINNQISRFLEVRSLGFGWRVRRAFTARSIGKFILIMTLFNFASVILILQFQVRTFSEDLTPTRDKKYVNSIDHSFEFSNFQNIDYNSKTKKLFLTETNKIYPSPINFEKYNDKNSLKAILEETSTKSSNQINWLLTTVSNEAANNSNYIISDSEITGITTNSAPIVKDLFLADLSKINPRQNHDIDLIQKIHIINPDSLKKSLFFMTASDENGLKNNYFLSDVGKTACLINQRDFLQNEGNHYYKKALEKNTAQIALEETRKFINEMIQDNNINCNDNYFWDPLAFNDLKVTNNFTTQPNFKMNNWESASTYSKDILKLAFLSNPKSRTLVLNNQIFINSTKEALVYNLKALPFEQNIKAEMNLVLTDTRSNTDGYFDVIKNSSLSSRDWDNLSNNRESDNNVNAIISKLTAKTFGFKKGDAIEVVIQTENKVKISLVVSAINNDDIYSHDIIVDDNTFFKNYGDDSINNSSGNLINSLVSTNPLFKFSNYQSLLEIENTSLVTKTLTNNIDESTPFFGTIFSDFIDYPMGNIFDNKPILMTNPLNYSDGDGPYSNLYSIERQHSLDMSRNLIVILNIVLVMIIAIFSIILIVLILAIIDEASKIILTFKSIGYSVLQVNWIVLGDYVIWSLISLLFCYLMASVIFYGFSIYAWKNMSLLVDHHISFKIPLITLGILGIVILCGWLSSYVKIKKKKMTEITV
ncbi:ABC transporter permease [Spiroplasma sabaudiense Ar-1343]|uniref:ABC transporter permease n=1 Tax=Spiroplasma sabaudiense Ar-1343 TaxID=1276257 RepID=W6AAI1_9MOLU|nr:ABC transporter permease [Spiroplasma sabaudiense]AHI54016.1 ABC transporter permease [Spiroplasma sabaudiense Ar-1343]